MKEILRKIEEVYNSLIGKEAEATRILADAKVREEAVAAREARCTGIESAQAVLDEAEAVRKANIKEKATLVEEGIKFENLMREERQAIKNEEGRLQPLKDQEKQLFKDQQTLYDGVQALEKEKKEWKPRYIAKIKAHFAQSGGKEPNADDIQ